MNTADCLQRAIDYIEDNLQTNLSPEDAAAAAGFSVYHFCRLFHGATGLSVMQYATRRRLLHAAWRISRGMKIVDAAYLYGFDSVSGFSRAFRRFFGRSPREFLRTTLPIRPEKVKLKELKHMLVSDKLLVRALDAWNLTGAARPVICSSGVRSENEFDAGDYRLHVGQDRSALSMAALVESRLTAAGLPAPVGITAASGEEIIDLDGLFFRLTTRPVGAYIPASLMYTDLSVPRQIGAALAHLHKALIPLEHLPELNDNNLLHTTLSWSLPTAARYMQLNSRFVASFSDTISRLFPMLPVSPIHRNPTPDAFLFENGMLSGYSGFDMTETGIRLFDPCYAATAILSETLDHLPEETITRWPSLLNAILNGYDSVSPLTEAERTAVPYVVCAIQLLCVAYFSGQDQFATLAETNVRMTRRIMSCFPTPLQPQY